MKLFQNQQKINELVFANRNKQYGAYALRSAYGNTLFKAMLTVFSPLLLLILIGLWIQNKPVHTQITNEQLVITEYNIEELFQPIPEKRIPENKPKNAISSGTNTRTNLLVVKDNALDTAKHKLNSENVAIGEKNENTGQNNNFYSGTNNGEGTGNETISDNTGALDLLALDENPEFEGGLKALQLFVAKNLRYPNTAMEVGKQGTLYVKFVVDEKGKVIDVLLQNNLGFGLDEEALRVVKMIPDFKSPGKVKGKPVKTNYQLPIKFKLG